LRKFEILQKLGKGAYGVVWKAIDKQSKQVVALKKVFDAFQNATDAQRTYREVRLANSGHLSSIAQRAPQHCLFAEHPQSRKQQRYLSRL
jgi:mitogen-activated protein kinase 15